MSLDRTKKLAATVIAMTKPTLISDLLGLPCSEPKVPLEGSAGFYRVDIIIGQASAVRLGQSADTITESGSGPG
jgi:hypothetical protein